MADASTADLSLAPPGAKRAPGLRIAQLERAAAQALALEAELQRHVNQGGWPETVHRELRNALCRTGDIEEMIRRAIKGLGQ